MLRAVVFDMDGTLGDTLPLCIESFRRAVHDLDGRMLSDDEISSLFGPSDLGVVQRLFPERPDLVAPAMKLTIEHYCALHRDMAPEPFPGAIALLQALKESGVILAIVTGKCIETARITLREFGMSDFFPMVEPGSPRRIIKGECLKRIADHYALQPDEIVYIGDTVGDIKACREAGFAIFSAGWAHTADVPALLEHNPEYTFTDFDACGQLLLSLVDDKA